MGVRNGLESLSEMNRNGCPECVGIRIIQPDGTELTETNYCKAFPKGIPYDIAYGDNKHLEAIKGQNKEFVFEKGEMDYLEDEI